MTAIPHATLPSPRPARLSPLDHDRPASRRSRGRRFQLAARTPRELVVPLLTPILFAARDRPGAQEGAPHQRRRTSRSSRSARSAC